MVVVAVRVMLVVVVVWWELVCDVKPCCHAKELHDSDNTCCHFFQHWAHPIAHHWCAGQQHRGDEELRVT
jgi:hypothetical protein